jgi:NCAIR mutase (PurE)-related protein
MPALRIVDSITELNALDEGCIAVSGSHGGLSSAHYALAARPLLSVFNDAGVGLDKAGLAALDFLQSHSLAACAVAHYSARIGEAQSTLASGVVSHANALATARGIQAGMTCQQVIEHLSHLG